MTRVPPTRVWSRYTSGFSVALACACGGSATRVAERPRSVVARPPADAPPAPLPAPVAPAPAPATSPSPAPRAIAVSAAAGHTCALYAGGRVACWGDNGVGQAGGPPTGDRGSDPHWIAIGEPVTAIRTGHFLSCGLGRSGDVWCWGNVGAGVHVTAGGVSASTALPDDPEHRDVGTPSRVLSSPSGGPPITRLALSLETMRGCVVRGREVACWDTNARPAALASPELVVAADAEIVDLTVGAARACAIVKRKGKRQLECWQGSGKPGQARLGSLGEPVEVSMGSLHSCVRDAKGRAACWRIEVAPGWWTKSPKLVSALGGGGARSLGAGGDFACAAALDGSAACFLAEPEGLPNEVVATAWAAPRSVARTIPGVDHALFVAAGQQENVYGHGHACALREDGSIVCWGDDDSGQLGDGKRVTDSGAVRARAPE